MMPKAAVRYLFCWLILLSTVQIFSQDPILQTDRWISRLSLRADDHLEQLWSVFNDIIILDTAHQCAAIRALEKSRHAKRKRFQIKLFILRQWIGNGAPICNDGRIMEPMLREGLQMAYELEDDYLIILMHRALLKEYNRLGQLGLGIMHGMIAEEMMASTGYSGFSGLSFDRHHFGHMLYHAREYQPAIRTYRQAIRGYTDPVTGYRDTLDAFYTLSSWNNLGLCYEKVEKYDSAFLAYQEGLKIAQSHEQDFWTGLIRGNIGDILFKRGQLDSARTMLQFDVDESVKAGVWDNAALSRQWLARIDILQGDPSAGLRKLKEAAQWIIRNPNPSYQQHIDEAFAMAYEKLGMADSLYYYMKKYQGLHDSLERIASDNRAEIILMRMDNQQALHQILILNKEKRRIALIRNFILLSILLLFTTLYVFMNRQRLRLKLKQQQMAEATLHAEKEARYAREQLEEFTKRFREKSNLLESIEEKLVTPEWSEEQLLRIAELSHHTILTDEDWDRFKMLFEKVYPGFFFTLKSRYPDITIGEQRMAALSKLQVTTKEAASLLGINPNSVVKTRQRLKQRLGLDPDTDLEQYFAQPS